MHIRKEDLVEVLIGEYAEKGRARRVIGVFPKEGKILVEGVNLVYKHLKPSQQNPRGGRLSKEAPIDVSNVLLFCQTCRRGVRVGMHYDDDGSKWRICRNCKKQGRLTKLGRVSKPRPRYAKKSS
jgi:large subunit ribosomal protein L24